MLHVLLKKIVCSGFRKGYPNWLLFCSLVVYGFQPGNLIPFGKPNRRVSGALPVARLRLRRNAGRTVDRDTADVKGSEKSVVGYFDY